MSYTKVVRVSLKDGTTFQARLKYTDTVGWEAYLPHLNSVGHGATQQEAIVDAVNEASSGL